MAKVAVTNDSCSGRLLPFHTELAQVLALNNIIFINYIAIDLSSRSLARHAGFFSYCEGIIVCVQRNCFLECLINEKYLILAA